MRKRRSLLIVAMVIAATAATLFVGCKKEKNEAATNADRSEAQALLNRIEAFQTLRDAVNSGAKADGSMTVEEMRETLCLVSNYEHSEHKTYCLNTTLDTLRVPMPLVGMDGNVSEADVVATYNAFEVALQECMESINDEMVVPSLFSIVLPKTDLKDENDINIVFLRGQEAEYDPVTSPMAYGPFNDICLFWGMDLGRCDGGLSTCTDATKELTRYFKFDFSALHGTFAFLAIEHVNYVATDILSSSHPDWTYWEPSTNPINCDTWLFWQNGALLTEDPEPCLCDDELNCEYVGIKTNIALTQGELHYSPLYHLPYFQCIVNGSPIYNNVDYQIIGRVHVAQVTYANYEYIPDIR